MRYAVLTVERWVHIAPPSLNIPRSKSNRGAFQCRLLHLVQPACISVPTLLSPLHTSLTLPRICPLRAAGATTILIQQTPTNTIQSHTARCA